MNWYKSMHESSKWGWHSPYPYVANTTGQNHSGMHVTTLPHHRIGGQSPNALPRHSDVRLSLLWENEMEASQFDGI
jgi:hypothetical protein